MLTIRAQIKKTEKKVDGKFNVKVVFTLNRKVKRMATDIYVGANDLTKSLDFKENSKVKRDIDNLVYFYERLCSQAPLDWNTCDLQDVMNYIEGDKVKQTVIDFFEFSEQWIEKASIKGKKNYQCALNALKSYVGNDSLNVKTITSSFLTGFFDFLNQRHEEKAQRLEALGKRVPSNRATSLYLGSIRHLFNEAKKKYNDYDRNIIVIPNDPFKQFVVPKQEATRKRALTADKIRRIFDLPYKEESVGRGGRRYNLAKDCFIMSFCLMGMNAVDLFNATEISQDTITYYRTKTKGRRLDKAKMMVKIPQILRPLINKYRDDSGERVFNFHKLYSEPTNFNFALNCGLKEIGALLKIDDLEFYAARHSWATIALNKVGIDKYTIHAALNHIDDSMKVTDIYIERDFVNENKANAKVVKYVFGK